MKNNGSACYWCCHPFNTEAIGVPIKRTPTGFTFAPGVYCSFSCARSGTDRIKPAPDPGLLTSYANWLDNSTRFCRVFIPRAPHWSVLQLFDGPLTIEEFRKGLVTVPKSFSDTRYAVQRLHATCHVQKERFHIKSVSAELPKSMRLLLGV